MEHLYSVCWNITSRCNENCEFCFRKICKDNTLEENKKIVDNLLQFRIDKITLCGGEPLSYPYLFEIANYIRSINPNIRLSLTTNGQLIDDEMLKKILITFDNITLPIDSSESDVNENIGRGINHLGKVLELLNKIKGIIDIKINTVATKINKNDLINILNIIKEYKISRWKIFRFYPLRRGAEYKGKFYLYDDESYELENTINQMKKSVNFNINYNNFNEFTSSYFNIYPDGSVENSKDEIIGNLLEKSIYEIINLKSNDLTSHYLRNHNQYINKQK